MAADYLQYLSNEELIKRYNDIGDKKSINRDYDVSFLEMLTVSAMSKRRLVHKSKYRKGLPKPAGW